MEPEKDKQEEPREKDEDRRQDRKPYAPPTLVRLGDMKNVTLSGGGCGCSGCGS